MKIKEVMNTNPIVAEVPGSREDVLRLFGKYEVSGMPVVKAGTMKFVGVVTRNDVFRKHEEEQLAMIMNDDPIFVSPNDDISKASKIFYERRIHGLPVVEKGEVVGVISPRDILRLIETFDGDEVENYLSPIFVPIYEETPLPAVMKIFRITDVSALPVLDGEGKMVGIVADGDLFTFSHLQESLTKSELGIGEDEDMWTWEGIRDVMRLYYETSKIQLPSVPVKEVMIRDVITVFRKTKISTVAQKMVNHNIDQLPVMDEEDEIMGMIYDVDLMRALI